MDLFSKADRLSGLNFECTSDTTLLTGVMGLPGQDVRSVVDAWVKQNGGRLVEPDRWSVALAGSPVEVRVQDMSGILARTRPSSYEGIYGLSKGAWDSYPLAVEVVMVADDPQP